MAKKKRSIRSKGRVKSKPRKKKSTRKRVGAKRRPTKKKTVTRKKKPVKRRKAPRKRKVAKGRQLVKQVERSSVERVLAGKRKRRRTPSKKRVVMAGSRRRKVGALGGNGMLIGLGIGALALYLLTKKSTTTATPGTYTLPPLNTTNNYNRNTQSSDLVNYAITAGLAVDAIKKLIDLLNGSSDQQVANIYDRVNTTGDFGSYV